MIVTPIYRTLLYILRSPRLVNRTNVWSRIRPGRGAREERGDDELGTRFAMCKIWTRIWHRNCEAGKIYAKKPDG